MLVRTITTSTKFAPRLNRLHISLSLSLFCPSLSLVFLSHNEAAELLERRVQQTAGPLLISLSLSLSPSLSLSLALSLSLPRKLASERLLQVLCYASALNQRVTSQTHPQTLHQSDRLCRWLRMLFSKMLITRLCRLPDNGLSPRRAKRKPRMALHKQKKTLQLVRTPRLAAAAAAARRSWAVTPAADGDHNSPL